MKTERRMIRAVCLAAIAATAFSCAARPTSPRMAMDEEMKMEASVDGMAGAPADMAREALPPPSPSAMAPMASAKRAAEKPDPGATLEAARRLTESADIAVKEPELLAYVDGSEMEKIPLSLMDASVVVADTVVRVTLDLVFENPHDKTLSGTLMMSLPKGASPSYLGMFTGTGPEGPPELPATPPEPGFVLEKEYNEEKRKAEPSAYGELRPARVVDQVQGRETYETVTRKKVDPALSEWTGGSSFSTKIYPIPPKSKKRVVFSYDRPLPVENGAVLLPLPVPSTVTAREARITVAVRGKFKNATVQAAGKEIEERDGLRSFRIGKEWKGSAAFAALPADPEVAVTAGTSEELGAVLARVRIAPEAAPDGPKLATGKAVFFLDTSYSTKAKLSGMQADTLRAVLENDDSIREFAVVGFDARARDIAGGFVANDARTRDALMERVGKIWLEGATDFGAALSFAETSGIMGSADTAFLLSDGDITWGGESPEALATAHPKAFSKRWICYAFGEESGNAGLFAALTASGGMTIGVNLSDGVRPASTAHRSTPLRLESVEGTQQEDVVAVGLGGNLAPGQTIDIALKARKGQKRAELDVTVSGKRKRYSVPLETEGDTSFLACRAWADLYATRLLEAGDKAADRAALALSQAFSLSNRAASFLILETDDEYTAYKIESEWLSWRDVSKTLAGRKREGNRGAIDDSSLGETARRAIKALSGTGKPTGWLAPKSTPSPESRDFLFRAPAETRANDWPLSVYKQALAMREAPDPDAAARSFRTLTTIAETKGRDDVALRMAGFALLSWGHYDDAAALFARLRERRPFEAQPYLLEAIAHHAAGRGGEAALRYEIILSKPWQRMDSYAKTCAAALYSDLLAEAERGGVAAEGLASRRRELGFRDRGLGRIALFWNLDNVDVDLHVKEPSGFEVSYSNKSSPSGGLLHWDNTEGLGPELYEHPSPGGFAVAVNYFGSSSVEGAPPSSTFVVSFLKKSANAPWNVAFHATILDKSSSGKIAIVPGKWGMK